MRRRSTELGEGGEDVEEHLAHWIVRVVDLATERQRDALGGEFVADRPGVGHGTGETVQFRDDECVASAHGGECLVESGTLAVGPG